MVIAVYQQGRLTGYVRSVQYTNYRFKLTQKREQAKQYRTMNALMTEIETLARMDMTGTMVFTQG